MNKLKFTLKAWPVVTGVTIGLCYLTQFIANLFGLTLTEQANLDLVRQAAGWNWNFILLCAQILVIMPALEELIFRGLLFKLPCKAGRAIAHLTDRGPLGQRVLPSAVALFSSAIFSFAHYPDYLHLASGFSLRPLDNAFLALAFFGFAQCWLYRKTDRIWCVILNHALFNLTNLILLFILPAA